MAQEWHDDLVVALALAYMVDPANPRARSIPNPWVCSCRDRECRPRHQSARLYARLAREAAALTIGLFGLRGLARARS
jgi:hypothetical protein